MRTPLVPKAFFGVPLLALVLTGCTTGSGTLGQETRDLAGFDAIDVGNAFQVTVQVGPPAKLELRGDDNVVPKVRAEVVDSTLHLELTGRVVTKLPLEAIITLPSLVELDAGGASTVTVGGIAGEHLEVDVSGASRALLGGTVDELDAEISGASTLEAQTLSAAAVHVDASGSSKAEVLATRSLHAEASGASTIRYHGSPAELHRDATGVSSIEAAD